MKLFRRTDKESKTESAALPENSSTSNACLPSPGLQIQAFPGRLKEYLKKQRPALRLVYGLRALRESVAGLRQKRRGSADHLQTTLSFMRGVSRIIGRPMNITLEPTNTCNLKCPVCETGAGILGRAPQHMTLEHYKTIIDKVAPSTNTLMFYFMGEPFLNKSAYDMIAYAKSKGIPFITTCTNGDFVDPQKLVASGLDEVNFQIGGMTQGTHQIYRINSQLERVLANLKETVRLRNQAGSKMKIFSGFILMKHNEHEIETFKKSMADLGVDQANIIDPCVRTYEQGLDYLPTDKSHWAYDPDAFVQGIVKPRTLPPNECPWIYYSISIHVSGNVVPCCRDPLGENVMGNLITQSLDEVWNGEKFRSFREQLHKNQGDINICRLCSSYGPSPIK